MSRRTPYERMAGQHFDARADRLHRGESDGRVIGGEELEDPFQIS